MPSWHNEIEPYAAQWIRNNIAAGLIPHGDVDERSIVDVRSGDLAGYTACHFFAGFGGWPFALRTAGWPENREVWSGSCPCQPGSVAGKHGGFDDPRHLWPHWKPLIAERRPATIFGEQSSAWADWLHLVRSDLEAMGYAVGAIPMEAASADADHFRDRYWFVADLYQQRAGSERQQRSGQLVRPGCHQENTDIALADGHDSQRRPDGAGGNDAFRRPSRRNESDGYASERGSGLLANGDGERSQIEVGKSSDIGAEQPSIARGGFRSLVNREGQRGDGVENPSEPTGGGSAQDAGSWGDPWTEREFREAGFNAAVATIDGCQYLECPDGKWRRLPPPGVRWLGNGIPARVSKLRAIGNAIDPRPAVKFIRAYMASRGIEPVYATPYAESAE